MKENIKKFEILFNTIKNRGFIESQRSSHTGIGKTFEDACGIIENNIDLPDFEGIEIKSHRSLSSSYITLFTKAPTNPKGINNVLRERYGSIDLKHGTKVLHTSCFHSKFNSHKAGYNYKLDINEKKDQIDLIIKNSLTEEIENSEIYWSFLDIQTILEKKLKYIAYVEAETKKEKNKEFFRFSNCLIISGLTFLKFIELLRNDKIMFDIRIGTYNSGKNYGKTHDHGSGFRIKRISVETELDILRL